MSDAITKSNECLSPIECINKVIEHDGREFVPIDEIRSIYGPVDITISNGKIDQILIEVLDVIDENPAIDLMDGVKILVQLIEWDVDVYGATRSGYALTKNPIKS